MIKCYSCGKFCTPVEWKMSYSGYPPTPDKEIYRCKDCVNKYGSFTPQSGIIPNFSCGKILQNK